MTDAAKQARREYHKKWQREHPDKVRAYHESYWEKKGKAVDLQTAAEPIAK